MSYLEISVLDGELFCRLARGGAAHLRAHCAEVNNLNVFPVPDGDTGDNMSMTAEGGVAAIAGADSLPIGEAAKRLADGMLLGARGNSGVILSQFFSGIAKGFEGTTRAHIKTLAAALECGAAQAYGAVMSPAEGTILTVCREGVEFAVRRVTDESTVRSVFSDLRNEMYESLKRTPELLPVLKEAGVIDSGGAGLYYIIEGMLRVLDGEAPDGADKAAGDAPAAKNISFDAFNEDSEMEYGYCTECLLRLQNKKCDPESFDVSLVTDFLGEVGNSVVCFKNGSIVKLHVHTMTPEKVLEFCRRYGEFLTVKIENMSVQHTNHTEGANEAEAEYESSLASISHIDGGANDKDESCRKAVGTAVVCTGDGIAEAFRELGVDEIIDGGQTNNPSAADFIAAFRKIDADTILVFPNNKNIILAAKQAASMYDDSEVRVIESFDIGMGYVAVSAMDLLEEADADSLAAAAEEAMAGVTTGQLSTSVRDATINGVEIKEGDYIGFIGKRMVTSEAALVDAAKDLIDAVLADGDKYMLTAFCGSELSDADALEIEEYLAERYDDIEFYFLPGGQDVYPLIFVAE